MPKTRVVQVSRPKGPFEIVERDIQEPGPGMVRLKVDACGICHSDSIVKEGGMPGIQYPRVPGHEVVGVIDALGPSVAGWTVAGGWEWAGTADTAATAIIAATAMVSHARRAPRSPASRVTAATRTL